MGVLELEDEIVSAKGIVMTEVVMVEDFVASGVGEAFEETVRREILLVVVIAIVAVETVVVVRKEIALVVVDKLGGAVGGVVGKVVAETVGGVVRASVLDRDQLEREVVE